MIGPDRELFKWGPLDARPIYIEPFVRGFSSMLDYFGMGLPDAILHFRNDRVIVVLDDADLRSNGEFLFNKFVLDDEQLKKHYDYWLSVVKQLKQVESKVNMGLDKLSDDDLLSFFKDWDNLHIRFWQVGLLPEVANWGGEKILKQEIARFNKLDFIEIFEALSAPEDLSFFQKEELEFLNLKLGVGSLEGHQKKYYWLRNSYCFTKVLDVDFFNDELDNVSVSDAKKKIVEINSYVDNVREKKAVIIKKFGVDEDIQKVAKKLSFCVWWQDFRKQFIFIANHIQSVFLHEFSKRKNISFKELCYHTPPEILNNDFRDVKYRFDGFVIYYFENGGIKYIEDDPNGFAKPYLEVNVDPNLREFKGLVVSKGDIVRGKVKILLSPRNLEKMQQGDILVATMTSPDFIVAMRKASAIITDEGGVTAHAAIVSRELGIPCIVATRIATKVLKDDDLLEVDTDLGVVRKLK